MAISNPRKVLFPQPGYTKLDLARYYLAVSEGALRAAGGRPNVLVRYPDGIEGEFFYQKRAPRSRPAWIEVARKTIARNPSHLGSYRNAPPTGSSSASFASIGSMGGAIAKIARGRAGFGAPVSVLASDRFRVAIVVPVLLQGLAVTRWISQPSGA